MAATQPPQIDIVVVDPSLTKITITGKNFSPFGNNPIVTFGIATLGLQRYGNASIVATLPGGLIRGESYGLEVTNGGLNSGEFGVVLGAVGPQGPTGPVGPQGPIGPGGSTGPTGPRGLPARRDRKALRE